MSGLVHFLDPEPIYAVGAAQVINGTVVLLAFTDLSRYDHLLFVVNNTGAAVLTVTLETSLDGTTSDAAAKQQSVCQVGDALSFEVMGENLRTQWKLSAAGTAGQCTWGVRGRRRRA